MTGRERELGYCEEAQTYCSIAEQKYKEIRIDAIDDAFNSLLLMLKNGYEYPDAKFEETFIALIEDAIDSVKDNLKEKK